MQAAVGPGAPAQSTSIGRWLDNMLATHARLNQRKRTLEENGKSAGKTNGTEMTTGTKRSLQQLPARAVTVRK